LNKHRVAAGRSEYEVGKVFANQTQVLACIARGFEINSALFAVGETKNNQLIFIDPYGELGFDHNVDY
jgi:hypothetical protein